MNTYILYENGDIIVNQIFERTIPAKENGKRKKYFEMDYRAYRKLASACVNLFDIKQHQCIFFTFTLPNTINETEATKCFSNFLDNAKKTYKLKNYVYTKEIGTNSNVHFHGIFDIPFIDLGDFKRSWFAAYSHITNNFHNNNVRLSEKNGAIVKSRDQAVRYICKYATKARGRRFESRCYGISKAIQSRPRRLTEEEFRMLMDSVEQKRYYKYKYGATICLKETFPFNAI